MMLPVSLMVLPTLCLGVVILTSFVIFYAFRRRRQAASQNLEDEGNDIFNADESLETDTRWARAGLAEKDQPVGSVEMADCPACGGQNPSGADACAYCGRKL